VTYRRAGGSDSRLNATAGSLLGFLQAGPRSGWDLARDARRRLGTFWNVTQSQVYRELRLLEQRGLVTAQAPGGPHERRPYAITETGRAAFREWIAMPPGAELIRFPLLLSVLFGEHLDRDHLGQWLREHELVHRRRLDGYQHQIAALPAGASDGSALTLRFGIEYERAVLSWLAQTFDELREPDAAARSEGPGGSRRQP
jgi:DNA-binding PadR family transcriptional regulator